MGDIIRPADKSRLDELAALAKADRAISTQDGALVPMARETTTMELMVAQRVAVRRNEEEILQTIKRLAHVAGEAYYYRFPVKSKDPDTGEYVTSYIEGPTIKLANDLAREWGNCAVETRVFDTADGWIIYARFIDLQTGYNYSRPYVQRRDQKSIKTKDKGRAEDIAFQIGASKAIRNVIVNVLGTYADMMFEEAHKGLVKKVGENLPFYRDKTVQRLGELKVPLAAVEKVLGYKVAEWTAQHVTRVISELKAIQEGMTTADELWGSAGGFVDPNAPKDEGAKRPERGDTNADSKPQAEKSADPDGSGNGEGGAAKPTTDQPANTASGMGEAGAAGDARTSGDVREGRPGGAAGDGDNQGSGESQASESDAAEEEADLLQTALREIDQCQDEEALRVLTDAAKERLSEGAMAIFDQQAKKRAKVLKAKGKK